MKNIVLFVMHNTHIIQRHSRRHTNPCTNASLSPVSAVKLFTILGMSIVTNGGRRVVHVGEGKMCAGFIQMFQKKIKDFSRTFVAFFKYLYRTFIGLCGVLLF